MSVNWLSIAGCVAASALLGRFLHDIGADPWFAAIGGVTLAAAWVQTFKPFGRKT
jgi:1,4-dihydroxy-2-naphthoate octaprenyltransferase